MQASKLTPRDKADPAREIHCLDINFIDFTSDSLTRLYELGSPVAPFNAQLAQIGQLSRATYGVEEGLGYGFSLFLDG